MGIYKCSAFAISLLAASFAFGRDGEKPFALMAGDAPPKLMLSKWVKGTPVNDFKVGKTYVVEFWATWCGPCKKSIPHLSELQKEYKDKVQFVGVSIWESDPKLVEPFVKQMGDKMDYTVAMDQLPSDAKPEDRGMTGGMAKTWMAAAGQHGIPTAFIVNDRKVVWIGHPMMMDEPLKQVVDGTFDEAAFAQEYAEKMAQQATIDEIQGRMNSAYKAKDWKAFTGCIKELTDGPFAKDANSLNSYAWMIVDPQGPIPADARDLDLAMALAQKSVELNERKDYASLDTLARCYFLKGDKATALAIENEAASKMPKDLDEKMRQSILDAVKEYGG